jgi:hypothetical protein
LQSLKALWTRCQATSLSIMTQHSAAFGLDTWF